MRIRRLHRIIGVILLLPFLGWAITGFIFFVKPGYAGAYESLAPKTYPLDGAPTVASHPDWLEYRLLRTILGNHLIVRSNAGWAHIDPATQRLRNEPTPDDIKLLLTDAISVNPARYGRIERVDGLTAYTDTGVEISLNWKRVTLQQSGRDTRRIDLLYKIHYLQWTGIESLDKALGMLGLALLLLLTALGARLAFKSSV